MSIRFGRAVVASGIGAAMLLAATPETAPLGKYTANEHKHWSFQPRSKPAVPTFTEAAEQTWAKSPLDAFVLARMKKEGLKPSPKADRATLIRRVTFDLTGLPPTPAEVDAFVADKSPRAWESGRPAAGESALRRTLGTALAGSRSLLRNRRL